MAISVDRIHHQYHTKENVADFDFDVAEESKEFQKLSLTDNMPPKPQVPKSGKPLEQKPAVDFLYHDITTPFAPNTYSPSLGYYNALRKPEWMRQEKPRSASTYSPTNPDWLRKLNFELPKTYEEYVALKTSQPEWMRQEKPRSASTYSPSSPDWIHYVLPTYEEYVALKSVQAPNFIAPRISHK